MNRILRDEQAAWNAVARLTAGVLGTCLLTGAVEVGRELHRELPVAEQRARHCMDEWGDTLVADLPARQRASWKGYNDSVPDAIVRACSRELP